MLPKKISDILNEKIPLDYSKRYCEKFNAYDNSGLLVNTGKDVKKILFSLDLSMRAVKKAIDTGANMIITHHPCIFNPLSSLDETDAVTVCIENGISVYSMHLNLDVATDGIDERLAKMLGAESFGVCEEVYDNVGYGKVFLVEETTLDEFVAKIKKDFNTERVLFYGDGKHKVRRVGSFCGGGSSIAVKYCDAVDTVVTCDAPHHIILILTEKNKNVILLTHYASETYPFKGVYAELKDAFDGVKCEFFIDERFI